MKMFLAKLFYLLVLQKLCLARYTHFNPQFYGQDSTIIGDTDKPLPLNMNPKLQNALYYNYPVFHLLKQQSKSMEPTDLSSTTSTTSSTSTTTTTSTELPLISPTNNDDEFPGDLVYIAQHKLGLKRLEDLPSISELGELLGTDNATETIKYMRQLTATEQGIALMRAYIESSDDVDNTASSNNSENNDNAVNSDAASIEDNNDDEDAYANDTNASSESVDNSIKDELIDEDIIDDDEDIDADTEDIASQSTKSGISTTTAKMPMLIVNTKPSSSGFLQRFSHYISNYKLWPETSTTTTTTTTPPPSIAIEMPPPAFPPFFFRVPNSNIFHKPILVRKPLPYHYPIPLRPFLIHTIQRKAPVETPATTPSEQETQPQTVHLNTPRIDAPEIDETGDIIPPHVQQLAQMANVPPRKLEQFLQRKPKLAELAVRVSLLPLKQMRGNHEGGGAVDLQLFAAVQRAIEQDDDLKKLLNSADTLK